MQALFDWLTFHLSWWWLAGTAAVLALLTVIKILLLPKKPTQTKFIYCNSQLLGEKDVQSECIGVISSDTSLFAVIASGNIDNRQGCFNAEVALETFKDAYKAGSYKEMPIDTFFDQAMTKTLKTISDNVYEHNTPPSVIIAVMEKGYLHIAESHGNLRGSTVYLYKTGRLFELNISRTVSHTKVSTIKLNGNEVIMIASKGAAQSLKEIEIIRCLSQAMPPIRKCGKIETIIKNKRLINQENASFIIVEQTARWGR